MAASVIPSPSSAPINRTFHILTTMSPISSSSSRFCTISSTPAERLFSSFVKPISSCCCHLSSSFTNGNLPTNANTVTVRAFINSATQRGEEDGIFTKDVRRVLNPSMPYANIMCFKRGYNAQIFVGENEPDDSVVRRFRREVMKAGVIQECRRRRFFEAKQDEKKRKNRAAARRNSRSRRPKKSADVTVPKKEEEEEEEDNWDLPEGGIDF